ncbi:DUF305 domain-containing protein [Streptomyces sp. ATCC 21386]|uniref:DUF305 domain-containing protein n=1 Tax=Streptomyces sp. ATCC 21386 TaxID=2699428 RepID=UPI001BFF6574|nr:DUF305 domain-containing protein [Streptomyces sp. ATCC 21386]
MTAFTRTPRRTRLRRASATVGIVAVGALLLTACGDDMDGMDHGSGKSSPSASGDSGSSGTGSSDTGSGDFNDADVAFAQMMIPHHEQALDMAELADGRASDTELKGIAEQIEKAQDPEIKAMKEWLRSWDKPTAVESMPGMDHGSGGDGMMSDADMRQLKGMKGSEFDKMFAEMMIQHHNGAITMAEDERKNGKNDAAVKMADDIVKGQTAEVEQLGDILDRL